MINSVILFGRRAMSKLELILVRHGETDWNKERYFRGHEDVKLNATGIAQADAVAEALKAKVFDAIYSSTLKRALVTARRIAMPHEIQVREMLALVDINYGAWQGMKERAVAEKYPPLYERWQKTPWKVKFPGGDSAKKAWKRVNTGLRELLFMHGTGCVVLVSHRIPLKMMTTYLLNKHLKDFNSVVHDPCAISVFEVEDKRNFTPVILNDTRHLQKLALPKPKDF
jgi:broad specificity phosphatase PhoE